MQRSVRQKLILVFVLAWFSLSLANAKADEVISLPNYAMKLSVETTASKADIWHLWADVANWKRFDERLEYSFIEGDGLFVEGAIGYLKGKGAPKTKFILTKVDTGLSFTEVLKLPLGQSIHLRRYFEPSEAEKTIFTHQVTFKGGLKSAFHLFLAGSFKKDLKLVMEKMKQLAEQNQSFEKGQEELTE